MTKKRITQIKSVIGVIDAFGAVAGTPKHGRRATALWCDVGLTAVSNWVTSELIPPGWHLRMSLYLASHGYEVDPLVFGIRMDHRGPLYRTRSRRVA
jgi:hypothetical protein